MYTKKLCNNTYILEGVMVSILVDNWTLESAANSMTESINNNTPPNYEYIKLVEIKETQE